MSEQLIDWDLALIQKYNYSGPRYTSYPTALEFSEDYVILSVLSRCTFTSRSATSCVISVAVTRS